MKFFQAVFVVTLAIFLIPPGSAFAGHNGQQSAICAPRENVLQLMQNQENQRLVARSINEPGNLVEIFATRDGSEWTALFTIVRPDGEKMTCNAAQGSAWQTVTPEWPTQ